ncbi:hypothetical protein ABZ865_25925 [Streptomyces sp. NPDC047085]|uniref:hypothetical protein n=1 Tax=Streptomyces sp. NPDC047085 TaxID=3155140 RepID=UPI00340549A5
MTDLDNTPGILRDLLTEIQAHQGCLVDVLWALLRDNRPFTITPPARAVASMEG